MGVLGELIIGNVEVLLIRERELRTDKRRGDRSEGGRGADKPKQTQMQERTKPSLQPMYMQERREGRAEGGQLDNIYMSI